MSTLQSREKDPPKTGVDTAIRAEMETGTLPLSQEPLDPVTPEANPSPLETSTFLLE